tara:strand:- start:599 stop:784 length:186 start_codon:yes stop_codon:yes gene_type:complete
LPNSRDPEKSLFNFWISKKNKAALKKAAERRGLSMTELLKELVDDEVKKQSEGKGGKKSRT